MKRRHVSQFLKSSTARLAGTYLLIIMAMSIGFSAVFYNTSSHALGRQLPPDSVLHGYGIRTEGAQPGSQPQGGFQVQVNTQNGIVTQSGTSLDSYFRERINEGRHDLMIRLLLLNIGAFAVGSAVSYALARRSLRPIEDAMEAQAQFVSDASHELRTPLTAIQTSNEVFLRRPKTTMAQARQLIEQNTDDIRRLKELSDGLLQLSQESHHRVTKLGPLQLQDIVSDALTQVVQQATQKDVAVHDEAPDIRVLGDAVTLTQALVILLDNAVKYSEAGQNVYVTAEAKSKFVYLTVRDEGIGIRASDIPHLFRRFYRADNARTSGEQSGYGLGLPIAKQIIENHHGRIDVSSTLGKGSSFTVKLPAA